MDRPKAYFGNFNNIEWAEERKGSTGRRSEEREFNSFIDRHNHMEFLKEGENFSNNFEEPLLSKLDRFLSLSKWMENFSCRLEKSLGFYSSDHLTMILQK